jgi:hypothetical protein
VNKDTHITMDDAHTFAQGLIAHGWLNDDPNCVETLYRQLVDITKLPAGYELAISEATPEMVQAAQATGVNAAWSYAKCYRNMLDAQLAIHVPADSTAAPAMSPEVLQAWLASGVCTCPGAGDGSLRWPCPTHPPEINLVDQRTALRQAFTACATRKD